MKEGTILRRVRSWSISSSGEPCKASDVMHLLAIAEKAAEVRELEKSFSAFTPLSDLRLHTALTELDALLAEKVTG